MLKRMIAHALAAALGIAALAAAYQAAVDGLPGIAGPWAAGRDD